MLDTKSKPTTKATKLSMFLLAVSPVLYYYMVGSTPFNYFQIAGLIVLLLALFTKKSLFTLPKLYLVYWILAAFQLYFVAGIQGWSDYFPGGIMLFLYSFSLIGYVALFDFDSLYKYMKWIFIFASILFLFQFFYYLISGVKLSVFLPLGSQTNYVGMTYSELVLRQQTVSSSIVQRFSSIFAEPSYFAQYSLMVLGIELFKYRNKHLLYTKFSIFLIVMLILIQSGAGFLGLLVLIVTKLLYLLKANKNTKAKSYVIIIMPLCLFAAYAFLTSDAGAYIAGRTSELNANSDESSIRLFFGWAQLGTWSWNDIIFGAGRNVAFEAAEMEFNQRGFINTVVSQIMNQGLIVFLFLLLTYVFCCKRDGIFPASLSILLLAMALLESFFLGGMMLIITTIVFSIAYYRKSIVL